MEATSKITDVEIIAAARKCGPTAFLLISWLPANQGWCEYRRYSCSVNITGEERASFRTAAEAVAWFEARAISEEGK